MYTKWAHESYSGTARAGSTDAPAATFNCTVYTSDPYWSDQGYVVGGEGAQLCSGVGYQEQYIEVAIQTYIGLGYWDTRVKVPMENWSASDFVNLDIYWECTGSGTQTYRIVTNGWAANGLYQSPAVVSGNYLRMTCKS